MTRRRPIALRESLREAWRLLRAQPLRTSLTLFGLIWGTAAVIFLVSWGRGLQSMMEVAFARAGKNLIFVVAAHLKEDYSPAADRRYLWFIADDVAALRRRARLVDLVAPETQIFQMASFGARSASLNIRGVEPENFELRGVTIADGRALSRSDGTLRRRVAVIGETAQKRLGANVGDWIRLGGTPFRVVGRLQRVGTQLARDGPLIDEQVWVPIATHQVIWHNPFVADDVVNLILVRMKDKRRYEEAKAEVRSILAERLRVPKDDDEAVLMFSPEEVLKSIPLDQQNVLYVLIGGTTLAIGGIGILALMLDAVRERRREIGVRLAVGARPRDVLVQFFVEAVLLVALGGALGVAIGIGGALFLASDLFRDNIPIALRDLVPIPELSPDIVFSALTVMAAVALFAGVVPAWRAMKVDPALTLRAD
ncbi:MAG TPA: ABC transporter permease [Myxococcota bacterium]|nr:ABC transporter permease [Myxococcota bacterium]